MGVSLLSMRRVAEALDRNLDGNVADDLNCLIMPKGKDGRVSAEALALALSADRVHVSGRAVQAGGAPEPAPSAERVLLASINQTAFEGMEQGTDQVPATRHQVRSQTSEGFPIVALK